jgi:hypothetical protein
MAVFKVGLSILLLLTISLSFSFSALACEDDPQAGAGIKAAPPSPKDNEEVRDMSEARKELDAVKERQIAERGAIDYDSPEYLEALGRLNDAKAYQLKRHNAFGNVLDFHYQRQKSNEEKKD